MTTTEHWTIEIRGDQYLFRRYINGGPSESYRPASRAEATVWAAAIIQGFDPPKHLRPKDDGGDQSSVLSTR